MKHRKDNEELFVFIKANNKYSDEDCKRKESIIKTRSKTWDIEKEGDYSKFSNMN